MRAPFRAPLLVVDSMDAFPYPEAKERAMNIEMLTRQA